MAVLGFEVALFLDMGNVRVNQVFEMYLLVHFLGSMSTHKQSCFETLKLLSCHCNKCLNFFSSLIICIVMFCLFRGQISH